MISDLLARVWERLGRNTVLYPAQEVLDSGLNPAQTLVTLLNPSLITKRVAVPLIAEETFIDLRQVAPRHIRVRRVVLGNVVTEDPTASLSIVTDLAATTLATLRARSRTWWQDTGVPKYWYMHGRYMIGIYPRAANAEVLTLISTALPTLFVIDNLQAVSELPLGLHPVLSDIAAALLLIKQGHVEAERAIQRLGIYLGQDIIKPMQQALTRLQRRQMALAASPPQEGAA